MFAAYACLVVAEAFAALMAILLLCEAWDGHTPPERALSCASEAWACVIALALVCGLHLALWLWRKGHG